MRKSQEEVLAELLRPLTEEETKALPLVTREEIAAAVGKVDKALRGAGHGGAGHGSTWLPNRPRYFSNY